MKYGRVYSSIFLTLYSVGVAIGYSGISVYPHIAISGHIHAGADQPDHQQVGDEPTVDPPTECHVLSADFYF